MVRSSTLAPIAFERPARGPGAKLPVPMEHQQQQNWCWAAATVAIAEFYKRGTGWSQCLLATQEFNEAACCIDPFRCNHPWHVDRALKRTHNYDSEREGPAAYSEIVEHVNARRPLIAHVQWNTPPGEKKSGHVVVLYGYGDGNTVLFGDPWGPDDLTLPYDDLLTYGGRGRWVHTYYTRRA